MENSFVVNLDKIIDGNYPSYVGELASTIKHNGYCKVGDFFRNLYDYETVELMSIIDNSSILSTNELPDEYPYSYNSEIIILITMLLNLGEGGDSPTEDSLYEQLSAFTALAIIAKLDKSNMCEAIYDNFSIQSDALDLEVARRV